MKGKYVPVLEGDPAGYKKGLRIKVKSVVLDEDSILQAISFEYSGYHRRGGAFVEVSQRNPVDLPEK